MAEFTIDQLLNANVQHGHQTNRWNPKMFSYIIGEMNNIHIIDLAQSVRLLKEAAFYCRNGAYQNKKFLFVGTKQNIRNIVEMEAKRSDSFYVTHKWLGGMLTNWITLKSRILSLKVLEKQENEGGFDLLPKHEATLRKKELHKLQNDLGGLKKMRTLPDVAIIVDQIQEITAIKECRILKIPIISILDTDCDPDLVDIPIPGNNNSLSSIRFILDSLANSIIEGQQSIKK